jgi:hypothetical protein
MYWMELQCCWHVSVWNVYGCGFALQSCMVSSHLTFIRPNLEIVKDQCYRSLNASLKNQAKTPLIIYVIT